MKKEKTIEVTICDHCKQERETRTCATCGRDACANCSFEFAVYQKRWREAQHMFSSTIELGLPRSDFIGLFCKNCIPSLEASGFTKQQKAA